MAATISTTDSNYIFDAIATKNVDLIKGIAETTVLDEEQIRAILFAGSLEVAKTMIKNLPEGSSLFNEIAQIGLDSAARKIGKTVIYFNEDGDFINPFIIRSENCGELLETPQDVSLRYAVDNIAAINLAINLDEIEEGTLSLEDAIKELQLALLSNTNAPTEIVTPFLTANIDALRAAAFVHPNTDNAQIVAVMTAEDEAGNNIDGFKLAMIELLNTDEMISGNAEIVAYLLGKNQSVPVRYAMFKNYVTNVLKGGTIIPGLDVDALVAEFVK